ncbi:MAG TPA: hypothetical protein VF831_07725 [Anaerolineales bacterium]
MKSSRAVTYVLVGFGCVLLGAILPFLMVMRILNSTLFLNFFSYTISVIGLFLGIIGSSLLVRFRRKKDSEGLLPPPEPPRDRDRDW